RINSGRQPPGLVLAFPGQVLKLLGLARQIGHRMLVAAPAQRSLAGHDGDNHGSNGRNAPRSDPPQRAAVELVLLGQKPGQLAAGEGTRMRSSLPKVLHPVAGLPLLAHVLDATPKGNGAALAVVIGPDHGSVAAEIARIRPDAATFVQRERLGTAHAVLAAREAIARGADDLLVVFGDTPLISSATFERLRAPLKKSAALAVLGFHAADPTGYGRLLVEGDRLMAIR